MRQTVINKSQANIDESQTIQRQLHTNHKQLQMIQERVKNNFS